jgi:hypothetical protein
MHIFGVVGGQHPTPASLQYKKYVNMQYFKHSIVNFAIIIYVKL